MGWVHRCSMLASSASSTSACFVRAGDDALLQPGEEYHKWLRCVFETRRLSQICRSDVPVCGPRCQPLSAVPILWAWLRAVIEWGGGRLPRHSPLGGGRAIYEVRSSHKASNSGLFCLILTICLPLLHSFWPSDSPAGTSRRAHPPPSASRAAVSTPGPQP